MTDRSRGLGGLRWALPVAAIVVAVDQLTKEWALGRLAAGSCQEPGSCIDFIAGARFRLVFNTGAAFSSGTGWGPVLGGLAALITVVLLVLAWMRPDAPGAALLGLVSGGALGNLVDRVTRAEDDPLSGAVIDFIEVGSWWPVFNIADVAIVCGVAALIWLAWQQEKAIEGADDEIVVS